MANNFIPLSDAIKNTAVYRQIGTKTKGSVVEPFADIRRLALRDHPHTCVSGELNIGNVGCAMNECRTG
mgnify:CR=1 FL=1